MKQMIKFVLVVLALIVPFQASGYMPETTFQLSFEDKEVDPTPLNYKTVYVFNGDYEFKASANFDPYPYGMVAHKNHWLIQTVKTDGRGKFTLNVDVPARKFYLRVGKDSKPILIERSSDVNHTPSNTHLRVITFEPGSTEVKENTIYDLKKGTAKTIGVDDAITEAPFKHVALTVQREK
jgi:hypothetical protein